MDWRRFAKALLLRDGRIDPAEADRLLRAVQADGVVSRDEAAFLLELKREATSVPPDFARFVLGVLGEVVLRDGAVDPSEVDWLRKLIFEDKVADAAEVEMLRGIARRAREVCPELVALLRECEAAGYKEGTG